MTDSSFIHISTDDSILFLLWLICHSIYAPPALSVSFPFQDQGQKISACRKTHRLVQRLLTSVVHPNLKVVTRTSPGAVVKMYKIRCLSCESWWWPHKRHPKSMPCPWSVPQCPAAVVLWCLLSVSFSHVSPSGSAVTGEGQEETANTLPGWEGGV